MNQHKYLYFTIFLLTYIVTIVLNTCLLAIVYKKRALHEPMYIFICNLAFNGIYGSTSLLPHIMTKLSTQSHTISLVNCLIQIFCLHTCAIVELMTLAIMGYDRYAAICTPLHYHSKMSPRKLSCHDTSVNNIVGILLMGVYMFPQFFVILFSYAQILRICLHASKECQKKALQTCIPHLLTVLNYFFGICFELIQCT
ncbi:olfactory receptor 4B13-like [Alosa pseudoharengus]|uniref:olfactory receptor 4B13-like n=1 Tax=Alosa pseudoharengus TaxID=34774 RepID=UPI003F88E3DC